MRIKRLLALVLSLLFVFMFGCGGGKQPAVPEPPTPEPTVDDGINRNVTIDHLIKDGQTDYKVVYRTGASSAEIYAAGELVNFVSQSTGVNFGMVVDSAVTEGVEGKYISIGKTTLFAKSDITVDYEGLNEDGFIIKTVGKSMFIEADNMRGILYGVYDLLEKYLGVRFISSEVTYVPVVTELPLYETDILAIPAFAKRNLYSDSMRVDDALYARMRFNAPERPISDMYGGRTDWYTAIRSEELASRYNSLKAMYPHYPDFNVIHNAYYWVSPADYYESNPEFFARDEKGNTIRDSAGTICQLNVMNGITQAGELDESMEVSVAKVALESLKKFIMDDPEANVFFFGNNDWNVYDRTAETVAAEKLYGGYGGITVRFMNVLSREINKWLAQNNIDRKITLSTFAYLYTKEAPVVEDGNGGWKAAHESVIPDADVNIRIAPIELDWYYSVNDPNQIPEFSNLVKQWTYLTKNTMIWTYETNFGSYLAYYPSMRQWADNIRFFKEMNVNYLMMLDNYHGFGSWQSDLHTYVAAKMMWTPELKVQPLIDEFLYHYFGEQGAAAVAEIMNLFDDHFALLHQDDESFWVPFRDDDNTTLNNPDNFPLELLEQVMELAKQAIEDNRNDTAIADKVRSERDRRFTSVLLTPQIMILKYDYGAYYKTGRISFAAEFIKNAEYAGVVALSEVLSLINFKAQFGLQ